MTRAGSYSAENFVDGVLLHKAATGQREAIRELAGLAAAHVKDLATHHVRGHDDLTPFVVKALQAISEGANPNEAFGWQQRGRGRPSTSNALRDFAIRCEVQAYMRKEGKSRNVVCNALLGKFQVGIKSLESICAGLEVDTDLALPDDLFPLTRRRAKG